jgi:hypothetical protein
MTWTAGELLAAYKSKKLSPVEAVEGSSPHRSVGAQLKALYAPDFGSARKVAKESEKRWQKGAPQGALDGVPITIKENIATKGVPVPLGTAATELVPAAADAPASARVREAGRSSSPRPPCPTTACCPRAQLLPSADAQSVEPRLESRRRRAPARARAAAAATVHSISAPTSAARCGCPPAGTASSR